MRGTETTPVSLRGESPPDNEPDQTLTTPARDSAVPRAGMLATVRNRRGVVAAVEPFDGENGRLHLVHLEYKDWRSPSEERLLWELEPHQGFLGAQT